jgi:hypothetical protein
MNQQKQDSDALQKVNKETDWKKREKPTVLVGIAEKLQSRRTFHRNQEMHNSTTPTFPSPPVVITSYSHNIMHTLIQLLEQLQHTPLLRRTLHALSSRVHIIIILIHATHSPRPLALTTSIHVLEGEVLGHSISRGHSLWHLPWRQDAFEGANLLRAHGPAILVVTKAVRELDVELNVQVTKVVVAVRRHSLAADDLDFAGGNAFTGDNVDG